MTTCESEDFLNTSKSANRMKVTIVCREITLLHHIHVAFIEQYSQQEEILLKNKQLD
jgi:hypothetical protein